MRGVRLWEVNGAGGARCGVRRAAGWCEAPSRAVFRAYLWRACEPSEDVCVLPQVMSKDVEGDCSEGAAATVAVEAKSPSSQRHGRCPDLPVVTCRRGKGQALHVESIPSVEHRI